MKPTKTSPSMNLLLWRHAEAEDIAQSDLARQLTARGKQQAESIGRWLLAHQPKNLRIMVSPALRTRQTADALGVEYEVVDSLAPAASPAELLSAAGWPADGGSVLLVGHQPTLGRLAALLLTGTETDITIKKGALWWFASEQHKPLGETILKAVISPGLAK